ncbi:MAG: hypothetical protein ABSF66_07035 [Terriglobales bacterium]|jgi:hypothetical protein
MAIAAFAVNKGDATAAGRSIQITLMSRQIYLRSAVGIPGKAGQIILKNFVAEIIAQKELVKVLRVSEAKRAAQMYACTLESRLGFSAPFHWAIDMVASSTESLRR